MDLDAKIPNNVDLKADDKLKRALEHWQPAFQQWWREMGPEGFQGDDVYLRTAIAVDSEGWAQFDYVKMPDYRWGIFLANEKAPEPIGFGDLEGRPSYDEVPGEFRNALRRIIVTQGDTEPASVEQQRRLGHTCPSLYDLRNLFQVNVEEGRHLWAMVYLLHRYFGRDGREEAEEMLARRAGNPDKPRILQAFNQPCEDWLSFFAFTQFIDRDGKYQLAALAESGFAPLRRTTRFMLTEEAHHLFVGETGLGRIARRTAQLARRRKDGDVAKLGGIPFEVIQRAINFWFSYGLDLFGSEISSNTSDWFAAGLKGRFREGDKYQEHQALDASSRWTSSRTAGSRSRRSLPQRAQRGAARGVHQGLRARRSRPGTARSRRRAATSGSSFRTAASTATSASMPSTGSTAPATRSSTSGRGSASARPRFRARTTTRT